MKEFTDAELVILNCVTYGNIDAFKDSVLLTEAFKSLSDKINAEIEERGIEVDNIN